MPETVSIRPGVSVLSILRHLNYKQWFAIAEFVDNAVQSYLTNRGRLEALHGPTYRLRVDVSIETTHPPRLIVRDNAAGIARADFSRAFRPAAIPPDRTGLSEFGMGMKSAACWFSPRWTVRTKPLGEAYERTVRFDIDQIINDQIEELSVHDEPAPLDAHFTEIVLDDLHHPPVGRTLGKVKDHLTDIYRVYLREGLLDLRFGTDSLVYSPPSILNVPSVRDPSAGDRLWRKDISFDFGEGLSVTGFAALMDPMHGARSGFALFRRDRLIQGSGDEGYRPALIFGQSGNYRWRRLFGELYLSGFEVSHTKDGFQWDDNEQPFLELLKDHLDSADLPLLRQADLYRTRIPRVELTAAATRAVDSAVTAIAAAPLSDVLDRIASEPQVETQTSPLAAVSLIVSRELRIHFRDQDWLIKVELADDPAQGEWLAVSDLTPGTANGHVIEIRVSMAHPFMVSFAQTDSDQIEALVRVAAAMALAEKLARLSGVRMAKTIRRNVNDLLRDALSRP